ncbi:MAG: ROK family protein, partial [Clostridiales bacterium]|nr:ROK family protein [Clostridiales bacterium]
AAVLDGDKLSGKSRVKTDVNHSPEETALALANLAKETAKAAGVEWKDIEAIGIGSPGVIDSQSGTVVFWSNFHWENVQLAKIIEGATGVKTFVLNDANAAALGEAKFGAGKKYRDSVLITLGTGVGGGIIIDGKLFEGFKSAGGELGHTVIRMNGEQCTCGRKGCFERYASATALIRITREHMQKDKKSAMWKQAKTLEEVNGMTAFAAAHEGDGSAKSVVAEYVAGLGEGVANVVNLLRPQAVILGGGVSAEGEALLQPLREYVSSRIFVSTAYAPLEIVCAVLGNDAGLYGAACYAQERL